MLIDLQGSIRYGFFSIIRLLTYQPIRVGLPVQTYIQQHFFYENWATKTEEKTYRKELKWHFLFDPSSKREPFRHKVKKYILEDSGKS